jgi:hypothetical protein
MSMDGLQRGFVPALLVGLAILIAWSGPVAALSQVCGQPAEHRTLPAAAEKCPCCPAKQGAPCSLARVVADHEFTLPGAPTLPAKATLSGFGPVPDQSNLAFSRPDDVPKTIDPGGGGHFLLNSSLLR